ncbi:MAG: glycosyltransferase family 4 protein [Thermoguttaceae bacterium]
MRIGLVVEQFDPRRGGLEQWTAQFAQRMAQRGHEVHVAACRFGPQVAEWPILRHPLEGVRSRLSFAEAAEQTMRPLALDVVHDMGAGWYCDVFQPHGGSRRAVDEHNLLLWPAWMRPAKRTINRWLPRHREFEILMARQYVSDGRILLALSQRVAADFRQRHGVAAEQIRVIPNGVDTERFTPDNRPVWREAIRYRLGVDEDTLLLFIAAHNFPLKGVPMLLRAMRRLTRERRRVHLLDAGGKRLRGANRAAARLGVASAVTFIGPVEDTAPLYAAADVYVQPTFYDPCSLVVLEALGAGLPVITTRYNGVSELLTDGVDGCVLDDPADLDGFLARLEPLFSPAVRQPMSRGARQLALQHTLDRNCDEIEAVYREVAAVRRRDQAA